MGAKAAGSVFWAFSLLLFPVTVQLSSHRCVTYSYREICGLTGSSVEFPCSYPRKIQPISILGWSKKRHPKPLEQMPYYANRITYLKHTNNDCTMKLADLKNSDASVYYFKYGYINTTGNHRTCKVVTEVRLQIFESPVYIVVTKLVKGHSVVVADRTVIEGQRITLACSPTCAANLNSNLGYIWYKNALQLNGSRANSPFLSLGPVSNEDTGSYVCVMTGYKDLPSSAVNLRVQRRSPRNTSVPDKIPDCGSKKDSVLTHGCDVQSSTDQILRNCLIHEGKSMFTLALVLIACICIGLVITITVSILVFKAKNQKKKTSRCATSVPSTSNPNTDSYMTLDMNSMSAEYTTVDNVRRCSAAETVYENRLAKSLR